MILVTGAAGFIGSNLVKGLNDLGQNQLIICDDFSQPIKNQNLQNCLFYKKIHREQLFDWLKTQREKVNFVFHLGARTDTTEKNRSIFDRLNLCYSKQLWRFCAENQIPFVYASSAATYGNGSLGFSDNHKIVNQLKPLNPYGESKNDFDKWVLKQEKTPPFWAGLKFFNVYGHKEYHKGRMASVVFHTFQQIKATGKMNLFRSHHPDFKDGEQSRDFIYVKDVVKVCTFFQNQNKESGLYNVGTGKARSFYDLAITTFKAMGLEPNISFIDTPLDIRETYQYFTQAEIGKLRNAGYAFDVYDLEEGIRDYVQNYLLKRL